LPHCLYAMALARAVLIAERSTFVLRGRVSCACLSGTRGSRTPCFVSGHKAHPIRRVAVEIPYRPRPETRPRKPWFRESPYSSLSRTSPPTGGFLIGKTRRYVRRIALRDHGRGSRWVRHPMCPLACRPVSTVTRNRLVPFLSILCPPSATCSPVAYTRLCRM
jgi:hypothetical protein